MQDNKKFNYGTLVCGNLKKNSPEKTKPFHISEINDITPRQPTNVIQFDGSLPILLR